MIKKFFGHFSVTGFLINALIYYQIRPQEMNGVEYVFCSLKLRSFRLKG